MDSSTVVVVNIEQEDDADDEFYVNIKQEPGVTQQVQSKHYLLDQFNRIECTQCIETFDGKEWALAKFAVHWLEAHEAHQTTDIIKKKRGRPPSRMYLKCPDCFVKANSLAVLAQHLASGLCQHVSGPTQRKRGRPIKYHPIPSQKLTADFQLPPIRPRELGTTSRTGKTWAHRPRLAPLMEEKTAKASNEEWLYQPDNKNNLLLDKVASMAESSTDKKESNREAARRCRERKRDQEDRLRTHLIELQNQHKQIDDDIYRLRETRLKLREVLQQHEARECVVMPQVIVNTVELPPNIESDACETAVETQIKTEYIEIDPIVPMSKPTDVGETIIGQFNLTASFKFVCTTCHAIIEDGVACALHAETCSYTTTN